jgi:hypothetical protein
MLLAISVPSAAFTLSSPSLEPPVAAADVEHVWWHRWGWHGHHRHCWIGPHGHRHCAW